MTRSQSQAPAEDLLILLALRHAHPIGMGDFSLVRFLSGLTDAPADRVRTALKGLLARDLVTISESSGDVWTAAITEEGCAQIEREERLLNIERKPPAEATDE